MRLPSSLRRSTNLRVGARIAGLLYPLLAVGCVASVVPADPPSDAACGDACSSPEDTVTNPRADSGDTVDSGRDAIFADAPDTGLPTDTGAPTDAVILADMGSPADDGSLRDVPILTDTGSPYDAGIPPDADSGCMYPGCVRG